MKQVTISLDDALYVQAKELAWERGLSLDEMLLDFLRKETRGAGESERAYQARMELVAMARASKRGMSGPWNREEAYAERLSRYERVDLRSNSSGDGRGEVAGGSGDHGEK